MKQWNWLLINWITFFAAMGSIAVIPDTAPEAIRWTPTLALFYTAGRRAQQTKETPVDPQ